MSKPVFEDWFSWSGRRNRQSYFLYMVITTIIMVVALFFALHKWPNVRSAVEVLILAEFADPAFEKAWALLLLDRNAALAVLGIGFFAGLSTLAVTAQRCRDFGWTGWAALVVWLPYVGQLFQLLIFFIPGTWGDNRYGVDPTGHDARLVARHGW